MMRRLRARRAILPAAALAVTLTFGLSACGASSESTAAAMHASVVQIAERAAAGDYAGALAELALLDRDVTNAADNGAIDAARETEIRAAMDLVRADLEAADAPATPTPTPEPTTVPTRRRRRRRRRPRQQRQQGQGQQQRQRRQGQGQRRRLTLCARCTASVHRLGSMPHLSVPGAELAYESDGRASAPALLLIPAGIATLRMWDPQVEALAADHLVVRYDPRGFGGHATTTPRCRSRTMRTLSPSSTTSASIARHWSARVVAAGSRSMSPSTHPSGSRASW